ncbi:MAG TPA: hypothetical protein VLB09_08790 [Nitrospiria bacterium]|nr:hypothetical protein [Nitrospiria bacterium]
MLHITPMTVEGKVNHLVPDCATGGDSTSGGTFNGGLVDRLQLGTHFTHVQPFLIGEGLSNTSTGGIKHAKIDVFLKHGDSSGGGDLTEIDTGLRVAQQNVHTTALTTDEKSYTTGTVRVGHFSNPYALLPAKRYIAASAIITRAGVTTATAEGNLIRVALGLNMLRAGAEPPTHLAVVPEGDDVVFTTDTST